MSFEHLAQRTGNARAQVLADTLDRATGTFLDEDKSPSRALGGIDNRGSHFYLALYWARGAGRARPTTPTWPRPSPPWPTPWPTTSRPSSTELLAVQGSPADIGGYYQPDPALATAVMRPSATFNEALATLG